MNQIRNSFWENRSLVEHTASGAVGKIISDHAGMLRTFSEPVGASESNNLIFKCIYRQLALKTRIDAEKAESWDYVVKLVQRRIRGLEKLVADQKIKQAERGEKVVFGNRRTRLLSRVLLILILLESIEIKIWPVEHPLSP